MQPCSRSTTVRICAKSSSTGASTSMVSAVPAGDVMERDEVLGIVKPKALTIGTTINVVRLPGNPPTQCLSTTIGSGQPILSPASIIERVSATISLRLSRPPAQAVKKVAI